MNARAAIAHCSSESAATRLRSISIVAAPGSPRRRARHSCRSVSTVRERIVAVQPLNDTSELYLASHREHLHGEECPPGRIVGSAGTEGDKAHIQISSLGAAYRSRGIKAAQRLSARPRLHGVQRSHQYRAASDVEIQKQPNPKTFYWGGCLYEQRTRKSAYRLKNDNPARSPMPFDDPLLPPSKSCSVVPALKAR